MNTKFENKDILIIIICLLALVGAGIFELSNYHRAFPEHSIDFEVTRKEAAEIAREFLQKLDTDPGDKIHTSAFKYDKTAKTFIEKEVGLEDAEDLLSNHFRIWRWSNRWFKPLDREEIYVGVTPKGEITRYLHKIPEEAADDLLSIDEARRKSHRFLTGIIQIDPDEWEFIEDKTEVKPNRVDYRFTYKKKNIEIYDATYRFDVTVQGATIGEYREYLHVPEEWQRDYQRLRSLNATTATSAQVFFIILLLIIVTYFIIYLSRREINIRIAVTFGIVTLVLKVLSELNLLPLYKFNMDISQSMGAFYSDFLISVFLQALLMAVVVTILTGAGELIYSRRYPERISFNRLFTLRGLRTKHFFFSILIGITLAIVFMAFQTMFYLLAKRFGAWSPAHISYSDTLNTAFPWILILFGGFLPAVLEEFSFRMFAIPFVEKVLKSKFLAVLITAVIWGFAHANYPNQPFWIRGVEVSFFGLIVGVIFLKFGILTVLVWHYMIDAIYSSMLLFRTGNSYHIVSAAIALGIILIPLFYNLFHYFRRKGFIDSQNLVPEIKEKPPKTPEPEEPDESCPAYIQSYRRLSAKNIKIILILIIVFIAIQMIPTEKIGEYYHYPVSRKNIRNAAVEFLRNRGVDPDNYRSALILVNNYSALNSRYILEHSSVDQLNAILARYLDNSVVWQVRFYQVLDKEEYDIYVHPVDQSILGFEHLLPEAAEVFSIDKEAARFQSKEYLTGRDIKLSDFELVEDYSRQLPNRTEHTFIWESRDQHAANVSEGRLRLKTVVAGDDVSSYSVFYKIPEEWRHAQTQQTLFDSIRLWLKIIALGLIAVISIIRLTKELKSVSVEWKTPLFIAALLGGLWLILELSNYPIALINYNTSWGLQVWTIFWGLITLLRVLVIAVITFLLIIIATSMYPRCGTTLTRECRYHFSTDAVFTAILVTSGIFALQHLSYWLAIKAAPAIIDPGFQIPRSINYTIAPLHTILIIASRGIVYAAVAGITIFWLRNVVPRKWLRFAFVAIMLAVFIPESFDNFREYAVLYLSYGALILWLWIAVSRFLRNNIPAYVYTGVLFTSIKTAETLVASKTPNSYAGALSILCIVTILIIWLLTEKKDIKFGEWIKSIAKRILINKE